jgi:hypothetical protein
LFFSQEKSKETELRRKAEGRNAILVKALTGLKKALVNNTKVQKLSTKAMEDAETVVDIALNQD